MVELEGYTPAGVVERLRKARKPGDEGTTLAGISISGHFFSLVPDKERKVRVRLVVEQSGAEFKRRYLFVERDTLDLLKSGIKPAMITICGELVKQEREAGLEKCNISIIET